MNAPVIRSGVARLPRPFELIELVDRVLGDWAFLAVNPAGKPAEGPAPLPLEYSTILAGKLKCLMVLRSNHAFGAELAYACTGDPGAREQGADAFQELCNLLASHLLTAYLGGEQGDFAPFLPERSQPQQWPESPASIEAVMMVESFPLEVRLWAEAAPVLEAQHA
jgi:hypothetical protein